MYKVITDKDEFAIKLLNSEVMKRPTAVHNHTFAEKVANIAKKNGGDTKNFDKAIEADFKAKFGWLEYNLKRVCGIECIDNEERLLGEKKL